jgi:hypothetical protein
MSQYRTLVYTPPAITIKENAREVIFTLISAMCDNKSTLAFRKNADGDFKARLLGEAFGNIQCKHDKIDIEWTADEGKWQEVIEMINTGTSRVGSARSR